MWWAIWHGKKNILKEIIFKLQYSKNCSKYMCYHKSKEEKSSILKWAKNRMILKKSTDIFCKRKKWAIKYVSKCLDMKKLFEIHAVINHSQIKWIQRCISSGGEKKSYTGNQRSSNS